MGARLGLAEAEFAGERRQSNRSYADPRGHPTSAVRMRGGRIASRHRLARNQVEDLQTNRLHTRNVLRNDSPDWRSTSGGPATSMAVAGTEAEIAVRRPGGGRAPFTSALTRHEGGRAGAGQRMMDPGHDGGPSWGSCFAVSLRCS
jgi:hypothetical protein